jgi:HEAT repeat protein
VLGETEAGAYLLGLAEDGRPGARPYGALALGLIARAIGDSADVDVLGAYRVQARAALRGGLRSRGLDGRGRAAFAVALGLARDEGSIEALLDIVKDTKADPELRGYAAIGLGHMGNNTLRVLAPIRTVLRKRSSEQLRRATAAALGMLRDRGAVPLLLDELRKARSQSAKGEVVVALAKVGDERAVEPLAALLRNPREQDLTRALACAGLGIVGDLEWMPSLSRLSRHLNYRAVGSLMNEALSIL